MIPAASVPVAKIYGQAWLGPFVGACRHIDTSSQCASGECLRASVVRALAREVCAGMLMDTGRMQVGSDPLSKRDGDGQDEGTAQACRGKGYRPG